MSDLVLQANAPICDPLPLAVGGAELTLVSVDRLTQITPFRGRAAEVSGAIRAATGQVLTEPGRAAGPVQWFGHNQWMITGDCPDLSGHVTGLAAVTDQTDGWSLLDLTGSAGVDVMARLVPVDLRAQVFPRGHCLRSAFEKLPCAIRRMGPDHLRIMVYRSMTGSAVTRISHAMRHMAARSGQGG